MGLAKALVVVQLSLLVSTVIGNPIHEPQPPAIPPSHHHNGNPLRHAPTLLPHHPHHHHNHPPIHPPVAHPPSHSPGFRFPRTLVAVEGVVYCKSSCKYAGIDTLLGASPLKGATVKLQCNNTKYPTEVKGLTDEHGYFFILAPKSVSNYGVHKCKASLVSSPNATCTLPSNLHGGVSGGLLRPERQFYISKIPCGLFTVGPFAFEPKCPL